MFAVPGWAVDATSLSGEQPKPGKQNAKASRQQLDSTIISKKRKAETESEAPNKISGEDLEKLWKQTSGQAERCQKKNEKKKEKKSQYRIEAGIDSRNSSQDRTTPREGKLNESAAQPPRKKKDSRQHESAQSKVASSKNRDISSAATMVPPQPVPSKSGTPLTPLQAKMRSKLTSARFRHLNEKLYTSTSVAALELFTAAPELFAEYHAGFSQQVKESWPQNPVDDYIRAIKSRGLPEATSPLPRRKTGSCTIADLGCGDAPLARGCQAKVKDLKLKFHNFDLHAVNSFVTKADISNLPLRDGEADIAIFCLSLMGTNWLSFVEEAWRILRGDGKGEMWISEVKSRFGRVTKGRVVDNSVGKKKKKQAKSQNADDEGEDAKVFVEDIPPDELDDATDVSAFVKVLQRRGFALREGTINKRNKMFVSMIFTKTGIPVTGKYQSLKWNGNEYQKQFSTKHKTENGTGDVDMNDEEEAKALKPCVYKTR